MTLFYYNDNTTKDHHDGSSNVVRIEWENGCIEILHEHLLHSPEIDEFGNLLPALIHSDGSKEYWLNGERVAKDQNAGPCIEWADGRKEYCENIEGQ